MIKELAMKWPVMRQIFEGGDGTGREAMSDATKNLRPKNDRGAGGAVGLSVLCGGMRAADLSQGREADIDRGRSAFAGVARKIVPEGVGQFRIADAFEARDEGEISTAYGTEWESLDRERR